MTTSHNIHRSLSGLTNSAKRLINRTSSTKPNYQPFGSEIGRDRDFARVVNDLAALDHTDWRR